jgi:hypothetical protein
MSGRGNSYELRDLRKSDASLRNAVPIHRGPNALSHPACMLDIWFAPSGSSGGRGVLLPG